jgi:DNA-binding LacI/PurR family transcriptional regulator
VVGDNAEGARAVAEHLVKGQHQRFAFIAGHENSSTNLDREHAFTSFITQSGFDTPMKEVGAYDFDESLNATRRLLSASEPPDAIFCANDIMAFAAINVARDEFGLELGREISIAGFDDTQMARWPSFDLTSYAQNSQKMVVQVVETITRLSEKPDDRERIVVSGELKIRSSTRQI